MASQPAASCLSAEDYALVREAVETVDRLLDGLPPRVKQVFLLNRLESVPHTAIAAEVGISVATVERDIRQAYLHLVAGTASDLTEGG